jgi:hypothetical protein
MSVKNTTHAHVHSWVKNTPCPNAQVNDRYLTVVTESQRAAEYATRAAETANANKYNTTRVPAMIAITVSPGVPIGSAKSTKIRAFEVVFGFVETRACPNTQ